MSESVTRPLVIIFLTVFVNLIGFGIIIPLLPFYAETFGASPLVIGLLFSVFSLCQLVAAPALGDLSDRYGRRPVLIFSLAGTVVSFVMLALAHNVLMLFLARIVDGLSGGNISTARAYVADVTEPQDRARAYGLIGAAFGLFAAGRFGFDAAQTGYFFAAFGVLGAVVQGFCIRPIVRRFGDKPTFIAGLICAAVGLAGASVAPSVPLLAAALIPLAFGIGFGHPTVSSLVSRAGRGDEQGRVQGAAGAMESLGRVIGPVWGNASLQRSGEAMPYLSAAAFIVVTLVLSVTYTVTDSERVNLIT